MLVVYIQGKCLQEAVCCLARKNISHWPKYFVIRPSCHSKGAICCRFLSPSRRESRNYRCYITIPVAIKFSCRQCLFMPLHLKINRLMTFAWCLPTGRLEIVHKKNLLLCSSHKVHQPTPVTIAVTDKTQWKPHPCFHPEKANISSNMWLLNLLSHYRQWM